MNSTTSNGSTTWRRDARAALEAVSSMWPINLSLGAFAFANLGENYTAVGAVAGLLGAAWSAVALAGLGYRGAGIHVPRSVTGAFLATFVAAISGTGMPAEQIPAAAFLMLVLAGLFQSALGWCRLGSLIQYCPQPVMAGFMNAMAVLLATSQLPHLLGLSSWTAWQEATPGVQGSVQWLALPVGLITLGWILHPPRWSKRVPAPLAGVAIGSVLDQVLRASGLADQLGPAIGTGRSSWPHVTAGWDALQWLIQSPHEHGLPDILAFGFALGALASIDHLLSAKALEDLTHQRIEPNLELKRLGAVNALASAVGIMPGSLSLASSQVHHREGGSSPRTSLWIALMMCALALGLETLATVVPRAAIAGMLLSVAWRLVDKPTLALAATWVRRGAQAPRQLGLDLGAGLVVSLTAIIWGMLAGVAVGLLVATLSFIAATRHTVVRAIRMGTHVRSRRVRPAGQRQRLDALGHRWAVIELEGTLYFGTVDHLQSRLDDLLKEDRNPPNLLILDWRRVRYLDLTGIQSIQKLERRLRQHGGTLRHSHLPSGHGLMSFMTVTGTISSSQIDTIVFADLDHAMESVEDALLAPSAEEESPQELSLKDIVPLDDLHDVHRDRLALLMRREVFQAGTWMCRQGDPGGTMFFMALGSASVYRETTANTHSANPDSTQVQRLACFEAGTCFGELSLLDGARRDASVRADNTVIAWTLDRADLARLALDEPALAASFHRRLARELAERLRLANRTIAELAN